jgi:hypothetical protein
MMKITVYLKDGSSVDMSGVDLSSKAIEKLISNRQKTITLVTASGNFTVIMKTEIKMIDVREAP